MSTFKRLIKRKVVIFSVAVIGIIVSSAIFAPLIAPFAPETQFREGLTLEGSPLGPNSKFILGTDLLGRDLLSRLIYGARTSLLIGLLANGVAVLIGTFFGIIAGFLRGRIGSAIMRFTDLMMAFPALLLAITLSAIFSPSLFLGYCAAMFGLSTISSIAQENAGFF